LVKAVSDKDYLDMKRSRFYIPAVLLLVFLIIPNVVDSHLLHILIIILFYAYLGNCWAILGGYTGQLSLGHSTFFGIGAYTSTLLFTKFGLSPWLGTLCGAFLGMAAGLFIGYLAFRYGLKGVYFAIVTLAFSVVLKEIALNWKMTGGAMGLLIPLQGISFTLFQFEDKRVYYYIILFLFMLILFLVRSIEKSCTGSYFVAIREDEEAAESLGVPLTKYKLIALAISSFMTAIGGTFYAQYFLFIDPDSTLGISLSIDIILRPIIGGAGSLFGPLLGSFIMGSFSEITRGLFGGAHQGLHLIFYSLILIVVVLFLPQGIMEFVQRVLEKVSKG
jgi:branched-chain amino acid transport system permease protein